MEKHLFQISLRWLEQLFLLKLIKHKRFTLHIKMGSTMSYLKNIFNNQIYNETMRYDYTEIPSPPPLVRSDIPLPPPLVLSDIPSPPPLRRSTADEVDLFN